MLIKKGAMFGLDARIALAIFGTLSLVSGAALYSAIQQSKVVTLVTQMKEIDKAFTQFYLNTGDVLPKDTSFPQYDYETIHLKENPDNIENWNGPYITLPTHSNPNYLVNEFGGIYYIYRTDITHTTLGTTGLGVLPCDTTAGYNCQTYVQATGVPLDIVKAVDIYVDGYEGADSGNVRWYGSGRLLIKSLIVEE